MSTSTFSQNVAAAKSIGEISIIDAWRRLGGPEPRKCGAELRSRAFFRDGDGQNVAFNLAKNCYRDHRDGCGGGVLKLVMLIRGCETHEALDWLRDEFGLEDRRAQSTPEERERARQKQREAEAFDEAMQPAYRAFLRELEARRDRLIRILRVVENDDLGMELAFVYARIEAMRDAIGGDVDEDVVALTMTIVDLLGGRQ